MRWIGDDLSRLLKNYTTTIIEKLFMYQKQFDQGLIHKKVQSRHAIFEKEINSTSALFSI